MTVWIKRSEGVIVYHPSNALDYIAIKNKSPISFISIENIGIGTFVYYLAK